VKRARITAVAVGVAMTAGLTACGSGGGSSDGDGHGVHLVSPIEALKLASHATEQKKSAHVEATTTMGTPNGAQTSQGEGAVSWATGGVTGEMTLTQKGGALAGSPMAGKSMKARYTSDAMYVNVGDQFAATVGHGAHWLKYDYDALAQQAGASGAFLKDQLQNNNPSRSVQLVLATGKVKKAGTATVRGQKTTHYSGTVKVSELARMQSKEMSEQDLQQLQKQLESAGMDTEKIDLWINEDDLLVKKTESADTANGAYESTAFYSDYGVDVSVQAPEASDTMDFQKLTAG
jgi:hypothetical protein